MTAEEACSRYASRLCDLIQRCNPFAVKEIYGTVDACRMRLQEGCPSRFTLAGSTSTPADLDACGSALSGYSCDDYLYSSKMPSECQLRPGKLPDGAPCGRNEQCESTKCHQTSISCGTCQPRAAVGAKCIETDDCATGLTCAVDGCTPISELGQPCHGSSLGGSECAAQLYCKGADIGDAGIGVCQKPAAEGASCEESVENFCDDKLGLACVNHACVSRRLADAGEMCGFIDNLGVFCSAGGTCSHMGYCLAAHREGEPCNSGTDCLYPAACINQVCSIPDPSLCR